MFAGRKRAVIGMAVASAGSTVVAGAPPAGATPPAPVPASASVEQDQACAVRGLTREEVARGERSIVHCAPTLEEAKAAVEGDRAAGSGAAGEVSSFAAAGLFTAGVVYSEQTEASSSLHLQVTDCGSTFRNIAPPWRNQIRGMRLIGCSTAKLYLGDNLDGPSTTIPYRNAFFGLQEPFNGRVHSISFKA